MAHRILSSAAPPMTATAYRAEDVFANGSLRATAPVDAERNAVTLRDGHRIESRARRRPNAHRRPWRIAG